MDYDEDTVAERSHEDCWAARRGEEFGRLAQLDVVMKPEVVLEIDSYGEDAEPSVIVRCKARFLEEDEITGRRFNLARPWLHVKRST